MKKTIVSVMLLVIILISDTHAAGYTLKCNQSIMTTKGEVSAYNPSRIMVATRGDYEAKSGELCVYVTTATNEVKKCVNEKSVWKTALAQIGMSFTLPHTHSFITDDYFS